MDWPLFLGFALISLMATVSLCAMAICMQSSRESRVEEGISDEELSAALEGALSRELSDIPFARAAE